MIRINEVTAQTLDTLTTEILILKRQTAANIIEIGRRLIEAKEMVGHGNWLPYLTKKVEFSEWTARRFMKAAAAANRAPVPDLDTSKVFLLLQAPEDDRESLTEQAANMTKRELEEAVREANRAKREAEEAKRRATEAEARARDLASRPPQVVERTVEVVKPDPELARKHAEMRKEYDTVVRRLEQATQELHTLKSQAAKDASLTDKIKAKEKQLQELTALASATQPQFDDESRDQYGGLKLMSILRLLESPVFDAAAQLRVLKRDGVGGWCDDERVREIGKQLRSIADGLDEILRDRSSRAIVISAKEVSD